MRSPPPVSVRGTGGLAWRAVQSLLPALAAGACGYWALELLHLRAEPALAVAALAGVLAWRAGRANARTLAWDGQQWSLDGAPGRLDLMIDLGGWLLLRLRPEGGRARWAAFGRREAAAHWHALRAAVHAPVATARASS